jgi:hypothetical protein
MILIREEKDSKQQLMGNAGQRDKESGGDILNLLGFSIEFKSSKKSCLV